MSKTNLETPDDVETIGDTGSGSIITAIQPWFGSKRTLAPKIVAALGNHRAYWEPMAGSFAILLAKPPCVMETANDLHGGLINLARVLKDEDSAIALYGRLARVLFHENLFVEAAERMKARQNPPAGEMSDVDWAADLMLCSWAGRNGVAGTATYTYGFCVRYTANGGHAAKRWVSAVESIPAWHQRLRHVTILNRDAFEVLDRIDDAEGTAIYCDPPYLVKGAKYAHDFTPGDHARLAKALARFQKSRVVVSYYNHADLDDLYPGWAKQYIEVTKSLVQGGKRDVVGRTKAVEVLLSNDRQGTLF